MYTYSTGNVLSVTTWEREKPAPPVVTPVHFERGHVLY